MNIQHNFWQSTPSPILGLSPMDGVTDHPFRHIQKKFGNPAIVFTEFSSVEGITHGSTAFLKEFLFDESQRPVVAQIYGTDPQAFYEATIVVCFLGFDGVDINMGCPAKNVAQRGAGAGLIRTPELAQTIITSVQKAIKDWSEGQTLDKGAPSLKSTIRKSILQRHRQLPPVYQHPRELPMSVKTRIGYDTVSIEHWLPYLLEMKPEAITIHGRTLKQRYEGDADWSAIGRAAELAKGSGVKILGNGDVNSRSAALEKCATYNTDGVLIGRASFGNPYLFSVETMEAGNRPISDLAHVALVHSEVYEQSMTLFEKYSFMPMRKHLGWYIRGIPDASLIRAQLFKAQSAQEVRTILQATHLLDEP